MERWLADEERAALLEGATQRRYEPGAFLFHEGDPPGWLAVLLSGHAKVMSAGSNGTETVLSVLGPGELVGELSAVDGSPRSASVCALEPVEASLVTPEAFERFLTRHPAATLALLRLLARRLRAADRLQIEFGTTDALGRVARRLLELVERHGVDDAAGVRIDLPIRQEDLAGWVGASRESVAKSLRSLRERGIVTTARRCIVVCDLDALRARAAR